MKKIFITLSIFFISTITVLCQTNTQYKQYPDYSKSSLFDTGNELGDVQTNNIEILGRVWGYVKYHHPRFTDNYLNADFEFFNLLLQIYNSSKTERNAILYKWVSSLGNYEEYPYEVSQYVNKNNSNWMDDQVLGQQLSDELKKLRWAKRNGNQYVEQTDIHVIFHEDSYNNLDEETFDIGYRILGVVRYWNIVEYYSPNKDITDKKWDDVLPEFIGKAMDKSIDNYKLYANLISQLNDTHAYTPNTSILGSGLAPIVAKFAQERMFVTDTCSWGKIKFDIGDEITTINGIRPIDKLVEIDAYTSHSNRAALLRDASYMSFLTKDSLMRVGYIRNDNKYEIEAPIVTIRDFVSRIYQNLFPSPDEALKILSDEIAYLNIGSLKSSQSKEIYHSIQNINNLIIDIRTYPADYNIKTEFFGRYFVKEPGLFVCTLTPIANLPGYFRKESSLNGEANENAFRGNIIILVNAQTQSMGEYFAMLLQSLPNSTTIGSCTAGADGNISEVVFPYEISSCISGIGAIYPDGTNAQRKGVKIDIQVNPTISGMKAGKDEILEKAIEFITINNSKN